jgi:hypothetical protein
MEEQSRREFASANPTKGTQDATFQKPWLSPEIPLNPRCRLQYLQRPTPPHISPNAPKLTRHGNEHLARGSHGYLKLRETQAFRILGSAT